MLDRQKKILYFNTFLNFSRFIYVNLEKQWEKVAKESGLSSAQQHCLWILFIHEGMTLTQLSNIALWNKSTTSEIVTRLEKKKWIYKKRDNHEIKLYLTEDGKSLVKNSVKNSSCEQFISIFDSLEEDEIKQILETLKQSCDLISLNENKDFKSFVLNYSKDIKDKL